MPLGRQRALGASVEALASQERLRMRPMSFRPDFFERLGCCGRSGIERACMDDHPTTGRPHLKRLVSAMETAGRTGVLSDA
jgi:hypothetical protein